MTVNSQGRGFSHGFDDDNYHSPYTCGPSSHQSMMMPPSPESRQDCMLRYASLPSAKSVVAPCAAIDAPPPSQPRRELKSQVQSTLQENRENFIENWGNDQTPIVDVVDVVSDDEDMKVINDVRETRRQQTRYANPAATTTTAAMTKTIRSNTASSSPSMYIYEMFMYIISGVILIFMMDQLVKLGAAMRGGVR